MIAYSKYYNTQLVNGELYFNISPMWIMWWYKKQGNLSTAVSEWPQLSVFVYCHNMHCNQSLEVILLYLWLNAIDRIAWKRRTIYIKLSRLKRFNFNINFLEDLFLVTYLQRAWRSSAGGAALPQKNYLQCKSDLSESVSLSTVTIFTSIINTKKSSYTSVIKWHGQDCVIASYILHQTLEMNRFNCNITAAR